MDKEKFNIELNHALRNGNREEAERLINEYVEWYMYEELGFREHEEFIREHEEFIRKCEEDNKKVDEFIRSLKKDRVSSSIKYFFPIGEA